MNSHSHEFCQMVRRITLSLADKFRFGPHEREDLCQEAWIMAQEALPKYRAELSSISTFIYNHLYRRLYNFKRNGYQRWTPPCRDCPLQAFRPNGGGKDGSSCAIYSSEEECALYRAWQVRNESKRTLASAAPSQSTPRHCLRQAEVPAIEKDESISLFLDELAKSHPKHAQRVREIISGVGEPSTPSELSALLSLIEEVHSGA